MNLDSNDDSIGSMLLEQERKYHRYLQNMSLADRLRRLEELQEQTYEILRVREANGGQPIPEAWRRWAMAQEDIGLKK